MTYKFLKQRGALHEVGAAANAASAAPSSGAIDIAGHRVTPELAELLPESVARENMVVPMAFDGERLTLAAVDADDISLADKLRFILAKDIRLVAVSRNVIVEALN